MDSRQRVIVYDTPVHGVFNFFMKKPITCCVLDACTTLSDDLSLRALEELAEVTVYDRTPPERTVERAKGFDVLVTNKVILSREVLDQLPELKAVFLMSTGTNAVDLRACSERNIPVCNIPAYSTVSVAEYVFACLFDWARGVSAHAASVRKGDWAGQADFSYTLTPQRELAGITLGLFGFGDIAQNVARRARAFDLRVLATTPHPEGKPDLGQTFVSFEELLAASDILSVHCPLTDETAGMMNAEVFSAMRPGSVFINTSRGGVVDEPALAAALETGTLSTAYLDVLSTEPPLNSNPLPPLQNAVITPHLAWATRAARERLLEVLAGNLRAWIQGNPQNVVNGV
jgi:glycerate dehydrogenase